MTYTIDSKPLWQPNPNTVSDTPMAIFMQAMGHGRYDDLWQWSVDQPEAFWSKLWDFCGVVGEKGNEILVDRNKMPGARWFPESRLNYAENLLKNREDGEALVFWGEDKVKRRISRAELHAEVARFQQFLIAAGIGEGDRVAGFLPNLPETLVACKACWTVSARLNPRCWFASMATGTTENKLIVLRRMPKSSAKCRHYSKPWWFPT